MRYLQPQPDMQAAYISHFYILKGENSMTIVNTSNKQLFRLLALCLCVFAFVGIAMLNGTTVAFCEDTTTPSDADVATTIQGAFSGLTKQIYDIMRAIVIPCCIVALAFAGFQFLVGGNQGAEKARKAVIAVILTVCFVVFAPLALYTIGDMVKSNGTSDWNSYNPLGSAT